jgi:hypothetical protein
LQEPFRNVDRTVALEAWLGGAGIPGDPPSSAWSFVAAPADEDAGFDDELIFLSQDDVQVEWSAARLGIP